MLDKDGYRPNVGIILCNARGEVLWARRTGHDGWQFPQGGVRANESPEEAMYRELQEEVGLEPAHVRLIGRTREWLHYKLPRHMRSDGARRTFKGQKQIWFLLEFVGKEADVALDAGDKPEFDDWRWVDYWSPVDRIVEFKREVYKKALTELEPLLSSLDAVSR